MRVAAEHAGDAVVRHDEGEERERRVEHGRRAVDHRAHGRVDRADHVVARDERAQPVREMDDLGRRDPRKEVLRAAGEADHLVRKHRTADQDVVVLGDQAIERDRHVLPQTSAGQIRDLGGRNRAEVGERGRIVPAMIEDPMLAGPAVDDRRAEMVRQLLVGHRRVRAERDEKVERRHARTEFAHERRRTRAASASSACRPARARARGGRPRATRQSVAERVRELRGAEISRGNAVTNDARPPGFLHGRFQTIVGARSVIPGAYRAIVHRYCGGIRDREACERSGMSPPYVPPERVKKRNSRLRRYPLVRASRSQ